MEGVFVKCSQFRCWRLTVLFLLCKNYVEGCNGRTLRLSARHGLRHVAPVRVSMYQICRQLYLLPLASKIFPVCQCSILTDTMLTSERPHQRFHLLQFWPRRNEACCWPLVSSGKLMLCPLCCIQGSKTQGYALTWFSHFGYQSIWSKADNLQSILRGSWGHRNCKTDTSERFLDLVFGEALGQAVKDDTPACRWRCKSWHREVAQ